MQHNNKTIASTTALLIFAIFHQIWQFPIRFCDLPSEFAIRFCHIPSFFRLAPKWLSWDRAGQTGPARAKPGQTG
jgi:hypothetical protein